MYMAYKSKTYNKYINKTKSLSFTVCIRNYNILLLINSILDYFDSKYAYKRLKET